ncbi:MAG: hypothetical protein ACTHJ3_19470 [Pararhizobium sp.]
MSNSIEAEAGPVAAEARRPASWTLEASLTRPMLFAGLVAVGFANGVSEKVWRSVESVGPWDAALGTFDVSLILWGACAAAVVWLARLPAGPPLAVRDGLAAALAALAFLLPVPAASWLGLCVVAGHLATCRGGSEMRRAAALVFALTIPLFWARIVFVVLNDQILAIDAHLVGWVIGTTPDGNVVPLPTGGALYFAPSCSSVANLSLALLSAPVFVKQREGRWSRAAVAWSVASALLVVVINVVRISLIGLFPWRYDLIHGEPGATIAGWLTLAAILLIGYHRIGHDAPRGS